MTGTQRTVLRVLCLLVAIPGLIATAVVAVAGILELKDLLWQGRLWPAALVAVLLVLGIAAQVSTSPHRRAVSISCSVAIGYVLFALAFSPSTTGLGGFVALVTGTLVTLSVIGIAGFVYLAPPSSGPAPPREMRGSRNGKT